MRCAEISMVDEPLAGTAPVARGFVLVEHAGPWGAKALAEAGLGELEMRAKELGLKALLVRPADRSPARGRTFAAWCGGGAFLAEVNDATAALEPAAGGELPLGARRLD